MKLHRPKSWGKLILGSILWLLVMILFVRQITYAQSNRYSWQPNWFSGDKNADTACLPSICEDSVFYSNLGFPIQINGSATNGPFLLAAYANLAFAGLVGLAFAILLIRKFWIGLAVGLIGVLTLFGYGFGYLL